MYLLSHRWLSLYTVIIFLKIAIYVKNWGKMVEQVRKIAYKALEMCGTTTKATDTTLMPPNQWKEPQIWDNMNDKSAWTESPVFGFSS